jgi:hypothetical protein
VSVVQVGRSGYPLLCVDDWSWDPGSLVAQARAAHFIDAGPVYPGVRAPAPAAYVSALISSLAGDVERVFGAAPDPDLELCAFSLVTTPPAALRPVQRIPHFDGPEATRIAFVHYLCATTQGGTSFYRHRGTGLERVAMDDLADYRAGTATALAAAGADYVAGDSQHYVRIHRVTAAFDRLIVYPGNALHSADIGPGTILDEDPDRGRLTINGFGFLASAGR